MKKIVLFISLFLTFTIYSQETSSLKQKKEKAVLKAVRVEIGSADTKFKISGTTTPIKLNEIIELAKTFGVSIKFTNEKYVRNQLEYIDLNYFSNNKWETLSFGTEDMKLLPVDFSLVQTYKQNVKNKSFLIIKKNANDQAHGAPREIAIL